MPTHTEPFISSLKPGEVLDRFEELSQEKGWKVKSRDDAAHSAEAKQGVTFKAWGEHIEVSADETPEGTKVTLVVGSAQLVDWGEASAIEREVRSRLGG